MSELNSESVKQENSKSRQCIYKGTSSLEVVMTEELDGAIFLCTTSAELRENMENTDSKNFDRVVLQLHRKYIIYLSWGYRNQMFLRAEYVFPKL